MLNLVANGPSGYTISNSLRFRASASAYLSRTPSSAGNRQKWTWSSWVKRGIVDTSDLRTLFGINVNTSADITTIIFQTDNTLRLFARNSGTQVANVASTAVYRDPSAWYHIVVAIDTTQATAANRVRLYVNGSEITAFSSAVYPAQNTSFILNTSGNEHDISRENTGQYFDGYQTEINFIDGQQLTPSSFGSTNSTTGVWQPAKYTGTYGTNGFYLNFSNIALTSGSNTGLGKDYSGNGNYWNTNNISVTAGTTYDAMTDVPTLTSTTTANYAVVNAAYQKNPNITIIDGNLNMYASVASSNNAAQAPMTFELPTTGKYYFEIQTYIFSGSENRAAVGIITNTFNFAATSPEMYNSSGFYGLWYEYGGTAYSVQNGTATSRATGLSSPVNFMIAIDIDNGKMWTGTNGTWHNSGNPSAGTNNPITGTFNTGTFAIGGQANTNGTSTNRQGLKFNFGQQPFTYTPPTGFNNLNTYNLPTSTILQGNKYMDATTYTGNGSSQAITNAGGFMPDMVWVKSRSAATSNWLQDDVRGITKIISSDQTAAEQTVGLVTSVNSNGFTVSTAGGGTASNTNGATYVGWQWQAGQGSTSSNTSGSITSTVSVNTTAGFSVVTWTGTGSAATVGHGLGVAPAMFIVKARSAAGENWLVYHKSIGTQFMILNGTNAAATNANIWNSVPSSTVISYGSSATSPSVTYVAYLWAAISGYSAFGSYTGNGSSDGPMVYCNFSPKFILIKRTDTSGTSWVMYDSARATYNVVDKLLLADSSGAEVTATSLDFLSNGFKLRSTDGSRNASGGTYIYAAFASNPFRNNNAY